MICCDTCPYWPTCEEEDDFLDQVFHRGIYDDEEYADGDGD